MDEIKVFMLLPQKRETTNNKTSGTMFFRYWATGSTGWEGLSPRETWGKPSNCFDFLHRGNLGAVVQREKTYKEHSGHKYEETEINVCGGHGGYNFGTITESGCCTEERVKRSAEGPLDSPSGYSSVPVLREAAQSWEKPYQKTGGWKISKIHTWLGILHITTSQKWDNVNKWGIRESSQKISP